MCVLEFDCRFRYPSGFALNFQFTAGDGVTALVGPSGVGKTTVLNLIAGLLRPHSGTIRLRDQILFDASSKTYLPPERRGIGYVFQDYQLFPHLSVAENLRYGQSRQKDACNEHPKAFEKAVQVLELGDLVTRYPATLSGGQKQRVAIGRALLRSPRLLLLDEPLSALHSQLRETVMEHLRRIADEFCVPMLLVSHDRQSVAQLAGTTIAMDSSH
jgi:molybdate transport system ATP-binding protein